MTDPPVVTEIYECKRGDGAGHPVLTRHTRAGGDPARLHHVAGNTIASSSATRRARSSPFNETPGCAQSTGRCVGPMDTREASSIGPRRCRHRASLPRSARTATKAWSPVWQPHEVGCHTGDHAFV